MEVTEVGIHTIYLINQKTAEVVAIDNVVGQVKEAAIKKKGFKYFVEHLKEFDGWDPEFLAVQVKVNAYVKVDVEIAKTL